MSALAILTKCPLANCSLAKCPLVTTKLPVKSRHTKEPHQGLLPIRMRELLDSLDLSF